MLIDRSNASATVIATPRIASAPNAAEITPIDGSANNIAAVNTPPTRMNGRRRPPQNQTLSLTIPMITCPRIPASGPAAQTIPISWISSPYLVDNSQLSAEICTASANPIAVDGRLSSIKNGSDRRCCIRSMSGTPQSGEAA